MGLDTSKPITPQMIVSAPDLGVMNTRHLLALLRRWRHTSGAMVRGRWYGRDFDVNVVATYDSAIIRLREELSRRGHVPNKREGQAARREAAKRKR